MLRSTYCTVRKLRVYRVHSCEIQMANTTRSLNNDLSIMVVIINSIIVTGVIDDVTGHVCNNHIKQSQANLRPLLIL